MTDYIADVSQWPAEAVANANGYAAEFQLLDMLDHHQSERGHKCVDCGYPWPCRTHKVKAELGARLAHRAQTSRGLDEVERSADDHTSGNTT